MPAPNPLTPSRPSRASSIASADTTGSQQSSAALLGATKAFTRAIPPQGQRAPSASDLRGNGALAAASTAGSGSGSKTPVSRSPRPVPASREPSMSRDSVKEKAQMDFSNLPSLAPPKQARPPHSRSPSHQAAVLATSRVQPTPSAPSEQPGRPRAGTGTKRPAVAPKPRRLSEHYKASNTSNDAKEKPTDSTPIAPTTSLVDLFERRLKETQDTQQQGKRPEPIVIKPSDDLTIRSPKPVRSGITSMFQLELEGEKDTKKTAAKEVQPEKKVDTVGVERQSRPSSDDSFASASEDLNPRSPPASPPRAVPIRNAQTTSPSPGHMLKVETEAKRRPQISPSPMRQTATKPIEIKPPRRPSTAHSDALSVSSSHSLRSIPAKYNQAYPRRMTPLTTGDDLANALVASSLASSRGPSPRPFNPPAAPYRKKNHHHHHHGLSFSRTPSPKKGAMLQTLRKKDDSSSDSDSDPHPYAKHKKKRLVRKHPNKHHEGDRKRWRDAVTERERKRYEGVWAANKGLHYSFTHEEMQFFTKAPDHPRTKAAKTVANEQVSNMVAREIWNRSRLPPPVLETVWDLVDHDSVGRLHKEEFVVGMWLIDQRLKGRKLPVKVTETVWASVRGIQGIKIRK